MKVETIKEKWYSLRRYYCKEGFIDVYQGDSHHDPDLDEKPNIQVNNIITLYRLNGVSKWHNRNQLRGLFSVLNGDERELFTADEIWKTQFLNIFRKTTGMHIDHALKFVDRLEDFENFEEKAVEYARKNVSKLPIDSRFFKNE